MKIRILTAAAVAAVAVLGSAIAASAHLGALTVPKAGDSFTPGQVVNVKWTVDVAHNTQDLSYSQDGTTWTPITTGLARTVNTYAWTVPANKASATTRFRVCQRDGANVQGCTNAHNTQSLGAGIAVTGGEVYTAITGNFTISGGTDVNAPAAPFAGAKVLLNANARAVDLTFDIYRPERVTLQAFDTQGKLLAVLLDAQKAEGRHSLSVYSSALDVSKPMIFRLQAGDKVLQQNLETVR